MKPGEFYDRTASDYDKRHDNATTRYIRSREERLINKYSFGSILDISCGTGPHLREFGIDISLNMLKQAKKKGFKKIVLGDAAKLPFPSSSFDTVLFMFSVLIPDEYEKAFKEIRRVLRKNGIAIVSLPSRWDYYENKSLLKRLLLKDRHDGKTIHVYDMLLRFRLFERDEVINCFNDFKLEHLEGLFIFQRPYWGSYVDFSKRESFKLKLDRLQFLNKAAYVYIAVFRKP
jgi:ubiquinone/menaquinone biosynthesis C-methylase UbiE